ncbi:MAG: EAL domain-containing protein [Gammaproteobacteria bacterium]
MINNESQAFSLMSLPPRSAEVDDLFEVNQVHRALKQKTRYLQIIHELALALLQQTSISDILWLVAKSAIARLGFEDCTIYLLDETGNTLVQRLAHGPRNPSGQPRPNPAMITVGKGVVGTVALTGIGEIIADTHADMRYLRVDDRRLSEMAVPIVHDGKVIGVIDSEYPAPNFYTQEHMEMLATIASMASTKIASAMLIEHLNHAVRQLQKAKEELRLGELRYRLLYDNHPSMFFTLDEQGVLRSANHFAAQQLGYSVADLVGMPLAGLHVEEEADKLSRQLKRCLSRPRELHRWEACMRRKDGSGMWVRETARVVDFAEHDQKSILIAGEDITETYNLSQELHYQASHDVVTGLFNRREFEQRLERALQETQIDQAEHALCYLDLDMFKVINDTCGHVAGDELLRQLGGLFITKIRKTDTVARLGGDEFGVLMEHCSLQDALRLAHTLRGAVEEFRFQWGGKLFTLGVSIGVVPVNEHSEDITSIMTAADAACYAAKEAGRNRIHVYSLNDSDLQRRHREMRWVTRISEALENNRFHFYWQPITPVSGVIDYGGVYFEVLLRLEDESGNIAAPAAFLPAAERYGLAVKLDRFVVSRVLEWLAADRERLNCIHLCSINLSGHSLSHREFPEFVIGELQRTGVPGHKICWEITETAAIANLAFAEGFIGALKALGCRFALDDFGSGFSSFAYLKNLPVDFIKIDGAFIRDILNDAVDYALVRSISDIGRMMGRQIIAEFVSNREILAALAEIGVDCAQGDCIGAPQPLAALPVARKKTALLDVTRGESR